MELGSITTNKILFSYEAINLIVLKISDNVPINLTRVLEDPNLLFI